MLLFNILRLFYLFAILFFLFYSEVHGQCPVPAVPTAIITQPSCTVATGSIIIDTPAPAGGIIYSIDGTSITNITGKFPDLSPGNYTIIVSYTKDCTSLPLIITINKQPPTPPLPPVILTQPSCTIPSGTITVNEAAPTSGNTYSINGKDYIDNLGIFSGLATGTYNVTVKNSYGCISPPLSVTITAPPPVPVQPTATPTQPTCLVTTGNIVFNTPVPASDINYSIDGIDYSNTSGIFTNLVPKTYNATVKNSFGCISQALSITINTQPPTPEQPTATLTQPNCTKTTGIINFNKPAPNPGISYSIDGIDYTNTSGIFSGLASNTYKLTVKNSYNCISTPLSVTINSPPPTPPQPTATVTHPTCVVPIGTITVSSPNPAAGTNYSINGVDYNNTTGIFNGLAPDNYNITVKNKDGCISPAISLTVNSLVSTLSATALAGDIVCGKSNGTITVNATGVSPFTYSLNGAPPVTKNTFTGLSASTYKITVKDATGCTLDVSATVKLVGSVLAAAATAADIPCGQNTGSIIINVTGGNSPFTYSLNGAPPVASNTFSGLVAGNYRVTVKDATGCSVDASVTIKQIGSTLTATATAADIPCGQSTGKITVNVTGGSSPFTYSLNGAAPVTVNTFSGLVAGSYKVTVKDATGCSVDASVTIKQIGSTLTATATAADIPCGQSTGKITVNVTGGSSPFTYSLNGAAPVAGNIFSNLADGIYKVTVKDGAGCNVDISVIIKKIDCFPLLGPKVFVPTAFTPDNNSKNDFLQPYLLNIRELSYFKVYNRWGQLVFSTQTIGKGWDGNINGILQPGDTYTWILACIDMDGKLIKQNGRSFLIR